ncbi:PREDICTED: galactan beta-1,4-galactosyltransferase GALS2-like [Amphimedon queenslandica]|uniref:Glycosyltransferase family 92 protein n=2 Tax=Amphimedon queenslandica TaxID=400682 RepID=A0AAN0J9Y6_AMPQE|nr:PREDICTED: galactan beta-1,4-galactosyltransferase GALS2-like [Amphimedon queenslandica]|eukprot:XP_019853541.1 PREDICTED: galactan beta-1,4-galactosyltransferase GALS2-like [Amphimedon queenslandica]
MKKKEALFVLLSFALLSMMALSYLLYAKGKRVIIFRGMLQERLVNELDQDQHLFHPSSSLQDLWVTVNKNIVVRRLGFHDTRNSSYPSVVFNCMYDDRSELPHLRKLYSLLTFRNRSTACYLLEYWVAIGDLGARERYQEIYFNYILRTKEKITEAPVHGQISIHSNCSFLSRTIPIKDNTTNKNYTYAVCLHKSIYNLTEPEMLVHWVELNLALGVEFMTIYLQNGYIPESYYTLMIPYIKRGIVEVLDWGLRPPVIPGYTKFWGQTAVINECLYRNMYRVKYLGLYDIDEFIIPQKLKTVPELIETFEKENPNALKAVAYIARNAFFYKRKESLPEVKRLPRRTMLMCYRMSFLPRYYTFTVRNQVTHLQHQYHKVIVKPTAAIGVWTHWVKKYMDGYTKEFYFSTEDALIHHYRVPDKYPLTDFNEKVFIMSRYFNETFKGISENLCRYYYL